MGLIPTNMPMDNFLFNPQKFHEMVDERVDRGLMDPPLKHLKDKPIVVMLSSAWQDQSLLDYYHTKLKALFSPYHVKMIDKITEYRFDELPSNYNLMQIDPITS